MKIILNKEIARRIKTASYYTEDDFTRDARRYIKACKSGRLFYIVTNVSKSGMSRGILIQSFEGCMAKGSYFTYYSFLKALGFKFTDKYNSDIRVSGYGMNVLFSTNYNIIHSLHNMGFISKKECDILTQKIN